MLLMKALIACGSERTLCQESSVGWNVMKGMKAPGSNVAVLVLIEFMKAHTKGSSVKMTASVSST